MPSKTGNYKFLKFYSKMEEDLLTTPSVNHFFMMR